MVEKEIINLYYFDFGGRAEVPRLALAFGGVKFNDIRLTREEFAAISKYSGYFKFG